MSFVLQGVLLLLCVAEQSLPQWLILRLSGWPAMILKPNKKHTDTELNGTLTWFLAACAGLQVGLTNWMTANTDALVSSATSMLSFQWIFMHVLYNVCRLTDGVWAVVYVFVYIFIGKEWKPINLPLLFFLWVIFDWPNPNHWSYFMCLPPNCISRPDRFRSVCLSLKNKIRGFSSPILLTRFLCCHWIQWPSPHPMNIISIFFSGVCQCSRQLCGSRSTCCFPLQLDIWADSWRIELVLRSIVQPKCNYEAAVTCPLSLVINKTSPGSAVSSCSDLKGPDRGQASEDWWGITVAD